MLYCVCAQKRYTLQFVTDVGIGIGFSKYRISPTTPLLLLFLTNMRLCKQKFSDLNLLNHGSLLLSINLSLLVVVLKESGYELALLLIFTCFVLLLITTTLLSLRLNAYSTQISFLPTYLILASSGFCQQ